MILSMILVVKPKTDHFLGAITDYGPSMVQWMRNRQPRFKGGAKLEMERPSPSFVVNVCHYSCLCGRDDIG